MGGALSLMGNVTGAGIACWLGRTLGEAWVARRAAASSLARHRERLLSRGAWVIFLLRLNPLTSSDLVSYVAGADGGKPLGRELRDWGKAHVAAGE